MAILVGLSFVAIADPAVQLPFAIVSAAIPAVALTRYGLLAGCAEMLVELMSMACSRLPTCRRSSLRR